MLYLRILAYIFAAMLSILAMFATAALVNMGVSIAAFIIVMAFSFAIIDVSFGRQR